MMNRTAVTGGKGERRRHSSDAVVWGVLWCAVTMLSMAVLCIVLYVMMRVLYCGACESLAAVYSLLQPLEAWLTPPFFFLLSSSFFLHPYFFFLLPSFFFIRPSSFIIFRSSSFLRSSGRGASSRQHRVYRGPARQTPKLDETGRLRHQQGPSKQPINTFE